MEGKPPPAPEDVGGTLEDMETRAMDAGSTSEERSSRYEERENR